jgi:hypothetical protein
MAKQKVALECLSYHATAAQDQTIKLANEPIKSAQEYKLYSFKFIGKYSNLHVDNTPNIEFMSQNFSHQQILSLRKRKPAVLQ